MAETWRNRPGQLLACYLVLDVAALAWFAVQRHSLPRAAMPPFLPLAAFLAWRVYRGGRPSRDILVALTPGRCIGLARGYPLRFLTAEGSTSLVNPRALITDWAQWSLASFTVCYLIWLAKRRHEPPAPEAQAAPA